MHPVSTLVVVRSISNSPDLNADFDFFFFFLNKMPSLKFEPSNFDLTTTGELNAWNFLLPNLITHNVCYKYTQRNPLPRIKQKAQSILRGKFIARRKCKVLVCLFTIEKLQTYIWIRTYIWNWNSNRLIIIFKSRVCRILVT